MSNVKIDERLGPSLPHGKNQKGSPKILIADHNSPVAELVSGLLRQDGYEVRVEQSSSGAIQSAGGFRPRLLVIDPVMPGIMGDHAAMRISHETKCKVLFLTVAASEIWFIEMLRDLRQQGCDCEALAKPFEAEELLDHVHRSIGAANQLKERFMVSGVMLGYAVFNFALMLLFHFIMMKLGGGYSNEPFLPIWRAAGVLVFLVLQWLSTLGVLLCLVLGITFFIRPDWA